jgi:hypothetical protein
MPTNDKEAQYISNQRRLVRASLAIKWLEMNRPDVTEMIEKELDIRFPRTKRKPLVIQLPKSLQKLK